MEATKNKKTPTTLLEYKKRTLRRKNRLISISSLARRASAIAIKVAKEKKVSITYLKDNQIVQETFNGDIIILKKITKLNILKVKKGTTLKIF